MAIATRPAAALASEFTASGHWPNSSFSAALAAAAACHATKTALVDDRIRLTYRALDEHATRSAQGLHALGVRPGDVVSTILPNRAEAVVLFYALDRLGAVVNPIVPIYGARELRFILRQTESVAAVVPARQRGVELPALLERLRPDLPALRRVFVLGDGFETPWEDDRASAPLAAPDPNDVRAILYTSGTTADPKGVLHSDNTLLAECRGMVRYHRLGAEHVFVMPSPVGHISGLLYGVMLPVVLGATSVLMETWDAERFCALVARERGTYSAGATPFLQGVLDCPARGRYDLGSLRLFPCGGADVPPELIRRAMRELGVRSGRGYGSTEFPSITSSAGPDVPEAKRAETDGTPIPPNQIELREGEIWARGPELCLGYRDPALNAEAFDARGFFRTGDLGTIDAGGCLTITGRVKDIIVRKGEKVSAREIEDLLFAHPRVREVAVVPLADPEVGERICAVVVPTEPSDPPSLAELVGFLETKELSRRKLPERLAIVAELPVTASGKVLKQVLKERLAGR
jgi:cyclohexanecarboxylate-CoA ligase